MLLEIGIEIKIDSCIFITYSTIYGKIRSYDGSDEVNRDMGWTGIISIVALVLALLGTLTLPQIIWGRARLEVQLRCMNVKGGGTMLCCWLYNNPVKNPILKILNVNTKSVDGLSIWYEIMDSDNKQSLAYGHVSEINLAGQVLRSPISIPPSYERADFNIVYIGEEGTKYYGRIRGKQLIPQKYHLSLSLSYSGGGKSYKREFFVLSHQPYISWFERP